MLTFSPTTAWAEAPASTPPTSTAFWYSVPDAPLMLVQPMNIVSLGTMRDMFHLFDTYMVRRLRQSWNMLLVVTVAADAVLVPLRVQVFRSMSRSPVQFWNMLSMFVVLLTLNDVMFMLVSDWHPRNM